MNSDETCRFCELKSESPAHKLLDWNAVIRRKQTHLGAMQPKLLIILYFLRALGWTKQCERIVRHNIPMVEDMHSPLQSIYVSCKFLEHYYEITLIGWNNINWYFVYRNWYDILRSYSREWIFFQINVGFAVGIYFVSEYLGKLQNCVNLHCWVFALTTKN